MLARVACYLRKLVFHAIQWTGDNTNVQLWLVIGTVMTRIIDCNFAVIFNRHNRHYFKLILLFNVPPSLEHKCNEATGQRVTVTPKWVISKILPIFDPVGLYM
jgi:hypothetical protein